MTRACNRDILKIAFWNAGGINNKIDELKLFILNIDAHIVIVTETRLDNKSTKLELPGYFTYLAQNPVSSKRGGVATIVNSSIRHMALEPIEKECIQSAPIVLLPENNRRSEMIVIASVYCPPSLSWSPHHFTDVLNFAEKTLGGQTKFILCGDWNAKHRQWGCTRACQRGTALYEAVQADPMAEIIATGCATHFPHDTRKNPSAIDFSICKGLGRLEKRISSSADLSSDHLPILLEINLDTSTLFLQKQNNNILKKTTNIELFKTVLERKILLNTEIRVAEDINDAINIFIKNIKDSADESTPSPRIPDNLRRMHGQANRNSHTLTLDENTSRLLEEKRILSRIFKATRTDEDKAKLKAAENRLKKAVKILREKRINKQIEGIDTKNPDRMRKMWRLLDEGKKTNQPNFPLKLETKRGPKWTKTIKETTEAFVSHLEGRFKPNNNVPDYHINTVNSGLRTIKESMLTERYDVNKNPCNQPITLKELNDEIKNLKNSKAPGKDLITNQLIKTLPTKATLYLILIYNSILRIGYYPDAWKHAQVKMILKPGKSVNDPKSYRPISLLSGLSKMFERLLLKRLFRVDLFKKAIPLHQFGFRKEHGTEQQIARVTQFILEAFERKEYCSAVFLDISEAFDRVWHEGLLLKLAKILPYNLYIILESYLTNRTFEVKDQAGETSRAGQIGAGVPQGSNLGPILYSIFSSDMPLPHIYHPSPTERIMLSTYADDTIVLSSDILATAATRNNENYLKTFSDWADKWGISVNAAKTGHVIYTLKNDIPTNLKTMKIKGQAIKKESKQSYLGVILDSKLTLSPHVTKVVGKYLTAYRKMSWILNERSKLPTNTKMLILKSVLSPIWQYAIAAWGPLVTDAQIRRIQVEENRKMRDICRAGRYTKNQTIRDRYCVKTVEEFYQQAVHRFSETTKSHPNVAVRRIFSRHYIPNRLERSRQRYLKMTMDHITQKQTGLTLSPKLLKIPDLDDCRTLKKRSEREKIRQTHLTELPTLLRLEEEEAELKRIKKQEERERRERENQKWPPDRWCELEINRYNKKYRNGDLTRQEIIEKFRGQPLNVQRIILPDYEGD
uniref:Pol protein n=2 Tax=Drosophila melanogaster TaxID=7227 RepID=Q6Q3G6_DROME|nr:pol protein [Drosophila melanogaster]